MLNISDSFQLFKNTDKPCQNKILKFFNLCVLLFLVTPYLVVAVQP